MLVSLLVAILIESCIALASPVIPFYGDENDAEHIRSAIFLESLHKIDLEMNCYSRINEIWQYEGLNLNLGSHKVVVNAPMPVVWGELVHWESWTTWDGGMERVQFDGPIDVGSIGRLKLKDGPEVFLHVSALDEGVSYSDYFDLLGTRFVVHHNVSPFEESAVKVHFSAEVHGPTSWILGLLIRAKMAKGLPRWMDTFKERCEKAAAGTA